MSERAEPVVVDCEDLALARELFAEYIDGTIAETGLPNERDAPGLRARMQRDIDELPGRFAAPTGALLVAWLDGVAVGAVGLSPVDERRVEVCRLWVRPDARRAGVARALMDACLERAVSLGYQQVVLDVVPSRSGAIALYREMGFVDVEPFDDYPFPIVFLGRDVG